VLGGRPGLLGRATTRSRQERRSRLPSGVPTSDTVPWGRRGERKQRHGQSAAAPVPSFREPPGGALVRQGPAAVRVRCRTDGGPECRLAAQRKTGAVQLRSVRVSVAALTGPPTAAQTGIPIRPFVRELCVGLKPRRQCLGGTCDGVAVDNGGVGPRPARPNDPAVPVLYRLVRCLRCAPGSQGPRLGASHYGRLQGCASSWSAGAGGLVPLPG
jgi:hypothetical protein